MMPHRIILLRHGESAANVDPVVYAQCPDHLIKLTEMGKAQARTAGVQLLDLIGDESFGVYCSPYCRTIQTKDAMLDGLGRSPVFDHQDPSLREQEYGNMPSAEESEACREIRRKCGMFFYRFPDGESCADVYDRMALFMDSLFRQFEREDFPRNVIVVTHGTAIKCFLTRWYHWNVRRFDDFGQLPNCHVTLMSLVDGHYALSEPFATERYFTEV